MKAKEDIILSLRAHSFHAGEQLHARSMNSISSNHQLKYDMRPLATKGNKNQRQAGRQAGKKGRQGLWKADSHSTKGNKKGEKLRDKLGDKLGNKKDKASEKKTPSNKRKQNGTQWETRGRRTHIHQRETRRKKIGGRQAGDNMGEKALGRRTTINMI